MEIFHHGVDIWKYLGQTETTRNEDHQSTSTESWNECRCAHAIGSPNRTSPRMMICMRGSGVIRFVASSSIGFAAGSRGVFSDMGATLVRVMGEDMARWEGFTTKCIGWPAKRAILIRQPVRPTEARLGPPYHGLQRGIEHRKAVKSSA